MNEIFVHLIKISVIDKKIKENSKVFLYVVYDTYGPLNKKLKGKGCPTKRLNSNIKIFPSHNRQNQSTTPGKGNGSRYANIAAMTSHPE